MGVPAMAYFRGWPVIAQTVVRKERWPGGYRMRCISLVYPGQEVFPDQPVLRIERAGNATSAQTVPAGLQGRVVDITRRGGVVIECHAAIVRGTLGIGNQVTGVLAMWPSSGSGQGQQQSVPPGAILIVPGPLNLAMLHQALSSGIAGVIASSVPLRDLEGFLRTDLLQLLDSADVEQAQVRMPPLGILLTEGLGSVTMPSYALNLLCRYQGCIVLLSGATSLRQHIYPELIISLAQKEMQQARQPIQPVTTLKPGARVRVSGGEFEGVIGVIDYFFAHQQQFPSGNRARAVRLRLDDGSLIVIPIALAERIG